MDRIKRVLFQTKDGSYVYGQAPNVPILVWLVAAILARIPLLESIREPLQIIATVSLVVWAVLEVFFGVNVFRRMLGSVILFFIVFNRI